MNESTNEIWVIDDDELYVHELLKALEDLLRNYTVVKFRIAERVSDALSNGRRPAAVLLDMMMPWDEWDNPIDWPVNSNPAKNGIALAKKLSHNDVPGDVIGVITAQVDESTLNPLYEETDINKGNVLIKPARVSDIKDLVRKILASSSN